jgi:hemerythrin-like domain-containing protein
MLMNLIDFRLPATGFASPLVLWTACHERGQRMAQLLSRLLEHWTAQGPSEHVNVTAVDVRRYFDEAATRHHQDEDVDLFPRLLRRLDISGTTESDRLSDLIKRLDTEHREMETLWPAMRAAIDHCTRQPLRPDHPSLLQRFIDGCIGHHSAEEMLILPMAQLALQPIDHAELGASMAARRGTTWAVLGSRP